MPKKKRRKQAPVVRNQGGRLTLFTDGHEPDPVELEVFQDIVMAGGVQLLRAYFDNDAHRMAAIVLPMDMPTSRNTLLFMTRLAGEYARTLTGYDRKALDALLDTTLDVALNGEGLR